MSWSIVFVFETGRKKFRKRLVVLREMRACLWLWLWALYGEGGMASLPAMGDD